MAEEAQEQAQDKLPDLYKPFRHTVLSKIIGADKDAEPDSWEELDIQSDIEDARSALMAYLRAEFQDPNGISESKDGVFSVSDDMLPGTSFERQYRLK